MRTTTALILPLMFTTPTMAGAAADPVQIWEVDRTTTAGKVAVAASPSAIYARATNYAEWTDVFSDVAKVEQQGGGREDALVRFKSRALKHTVTVRFANTADRRIVFTLVEGPPGAVSTGRFDLVANPDGSTTISAALSMDVTGAAGLFIRDVKIRNMRQDKLRSDLNDLVVHFQH